MSFKYALIIANTEYADPNLAQLSAPGKDAEEFARVLRDKEVGAFDNVKILLNQSDATAREAIDEFFDQKKPDDLLLLYFSGHGVRDEVGSLYLAARNTSRARLRSTAIKSDFIREAMDQSRSKRAILILDCCNSGAFAQGTKAITGGSIGTASAFEGTGFGRIVLTASDSTQFAWEGDKVIGDTQNSLFTHFLIQGLEGNADIDGDGKITVDELFDYAYEQTVTRTPNQTPGKWSYKQQGEIVLRQSTRLEKIKPVALPEELIEATEDVRTFVREGAVKQLEKHLKGKNLGLARSAREALEKMSKEDDSRRVAEAAAQVLEAIHQAEQVATQKAEQDYAAREEDKNLIELKAAQEQAALEKIETERKEKERLATQKKEKERITREKSESERKAKAEARQLVIQKAKNDTGKILGNTKAVFSSLKKIPSKNWGIAGIILAVVLLGISGIKFMKFSPPLINTSTPTKRPTATATKRPVATATKRPAATATNRATATATPWPILAKDSFNDNSNDWETGKLITSASDISAYILNGKYIASNTANTYSLPAKVILQNKTALSDFVLSADVKITKGSSLPKSYAQIGLVFRNSTSGEYQFYIDNQGYYNVYCSRCSLSDNFLIYDKYTTAINKNGVNNLTVIASESNFYFLINDQFLESVEDNTLLFGSVGFFLDPYNDYQATFEFDNFELRAP